MLSFGLNTAKVLDDKGHRCCCLAETLLSFKSKDRSKVGCCFDDDCLLLLLQNCCIFLYKGTPGLDLIEGEK
jgi:hypothetical protein